MNYYCTICDYKTAIHSNYKKHLKTQRHINKDQKNVKKMEESIKKMEESIKNMEESITYDENRAEETNPLQCQWCRRILCRSDVLKNHLSICKMRCVQEDPEVSKKMEKSINNYQCQYCQNYYSNTRSLNKHVKLCFQKKSKLEIIQKNIKVLEEKNSQNLLEPFRTLPCLYSCSFCNSIYASQKGLNRHLNKCSKNANLVQKELEIKNLQIEKLQAINEEKDKRLAEKNATIEIAKQSKVININHTNKTINFLNSHFGDMIAMEHFLKSLEHTHQLTLEERQDLLNAYHECGIDVFARNFSYVMKQNCKRQLEDQGIKDMKLIPLFCSDGNLRSHKEKQLDGWKTSYDNHSINQMINISNQQIYDSYQKLVPVSGRERNKIYNEIKKDNHQSNLLGLKSED